MMSTVIYLKQLVERGPVMPPRTYAKPSGTGNGAALQSARVTRSKRLMRRSQRDDHVARLTFASGEAAVNEAAERLAFCAQKETGVRK
jgi:hypothetical protein